MKVTHFAIMKKPYLIALLCLILGFWFILSDGEDVRLPVANDNPHASSETNDVSSPKQMQMFTSPLGETAKIPLPASKQTELPQPANQRPTLETSGVAGSSQKKEIHKKKSQIAEQKFLSLTPPEREFEEEEIDAEWAFQKEGELIELFATEETLADYVLSESNCRQNTCKLSLIVSDGVQKHRATDSLAQVLTAQGGFINLRLDTASSANEAIIYLGF